MNFTPGAFLQYVGRWCCSPIWQIQQTTRQTHHTIWLRPGIYVENAGATVPGCRNEVTTKVTANPGTLVRSRLPLPHARLGELYVERNQYRPFADRALAICRDGLTDTPSNCNRAPTSEAA